MPLPNKPLVPDDIGLRPYRLVGLQSSTACREPSMEIVGAVLERTAAPRPYASSAPLTVATLELDPPGDGEILVRIEAAGICHSDLSVVDGSRVRPTPMLLGHEAAGIIEALGDGVAREPGDRGGIVQDRARPGGVQRP